MSRLPNVATAITPANNNTAYFVYVGRNTEAIVVKYVEFYVSTKGTGTQTAEVGLFSTPSAPNKNNQTVTKLVADGTLTSLTAADKVVARNSAAFNSGAGYIVPAGTHLWAGMRTAMGTNQPGLAGLCMDYQEGMVLSNTAANALTGTGPWTGSIITQPASYYLNTPLAPDLRITLD